MAALNHCPQCGCNLPPDAPGGLCPDCLLVAGLGVSDPQKHGDSVTQARGHEPFVPPKPHELADRFPQFEILDLLGYGGMGAVYKARQKSLDRLVALKIIKPDSAENAGFAERFSREARALARLNHSAIVSVYDFGETDGLFFFVMEYVDGTNLRRLIQSKELSAPEALEIIPQICNALQFAHDEGIVHRDIKPENILVDSKGRVKIADFGLAKLLGQTAVDEQTLTGTHQVMGTLRYMAPEQMEGSRAVDHRADIYSLGVVFYEMLTGEVPMGSFEPPSRKAHIDVRLDEIVLRSLAKEPERRYQHVSDVRTDVESVSQQQAGLRQAVAATERGSTSAADSSDSAAPFADFVERWEKTEMAGIVLFILFFGSVFGFFEVLLPWTKVHIDVSPGTALDVPKPTHVTLEAKGHDYALPILGSLMSALLFVFTLIKTLGGAPYSVGRATLASATGVVIAGAGALILGVAPLPNLADEYSGFLQQFGHDFTDAKYAMRELQILEVQGDLNLTVNDMDAPGCYIAMLVGVAMLIGSAFEMRFVYCSELARAGQQPGRLVQGPAAALRWVAWSSPLMIPLLAIMCASSSGWHSTMSTVLLVLLVLQVLHAILILPLILIGTARMEQLLSRRMAQAACILSMLPLGLSFAFTLPAAVWSLVVLARPDVERAFRERRLESRVVEQQLHRASSRLAVTAMIASILWVLAIAVVAVLITHDLRQGDSAAVRDLWILQPGGVIPILFWPVIVLVPLALGMSLLQLLCSSFMTRSRGAAITASVISVIPTSPVWIVGLPLGVWSLCVLQQRETIDVYVLRNKAKGKDLPSEVAADWSPVVPSLLILMSFLAVVAFGMWIAESAWGLAALAVPWLAIGVAGVMCDGKPKERAVNVIALVALLLSLALLAFGIFVEQSAWALFGIAAGLGGALAGMAIGSLTSESDSPAEDAEPVVAEPEEDESEEGETPEEKLEWAAWWIGAVGGFRSWVLLTTGSNTIERIFAGEKSFLNSEFLLQMTGPLMVIAAIAAYHARFYWFAVAGAILCLPTGNCFPVLLGLYSLVTLFDPKVRALFLANDALLSASSSASANLDPTATPPMSRSYGNAIGSTLGNAWTEWWLERDGLFTRAVQTVILLLHLACLLAFLGSSGQGGTSDTGQRVFTHTVGFPAPWFTLETKAEHSDFSFRHEIHWTTSAWLIAGIGMALAYVYCRIEKVRNQDVTFWSKPEAFMTVWAILAVADIGFGMGMGYVAMNSKRSDDVVTQEMTKSVRNETDPSDKPGLETQEPVTNTQHDVARLMDAVSRGNISHVKAQLDAGASVNQKDVEGRTLLIKALAGGHRSLALTLVVLGADLSEQDERGRTAMMYAVEAKDKVFLSRLRELQKITYEDDAEKRKSELRAFSGVERTILDGRDVDLRNLEYTALENQKDAKGETASLIAARLGDWDLFTQVATNLDSLRARDNQGRTIAMLAATHGHVGWFKPISVAPYFGVADGSNLYIGEMMAFDVDQLALTDNDGKTALQLAEDNRHTEIADILRRHLQAIVDNQTVAIEADGNSTDDARKWRDMARQALGETVKRSKKISDEID